VDWQSLETSVKPGTGKPLPTENSAKVQKRGIVMEQKKLGFGFMRLPVQDINDQSSVDMEALTKMVDAYIGNGFRYFDLAYIYHNGICESVFREVVANRYPRDKYEVCTKLPPAMLQNMDSRERIFSQQLKNCGVDYFDCYLIHGVDVNTVRTAEKFDCYNFVIEKKKAGLARAVGFSYHDTPETLDEILTAYPEIDVVQLQLNYLDWDAPNVQARACWEVALKHGKQIIVMEPVKGGMLSEVPELAEKLLKDCHPELSCASWAVRFAAGLDNVRMVLSGMNTLAHVEDNTSYMKDFVPLSKREQDIVWQAAALIKESVAIPCTSCRYCEPKCPNNIAIPEYFYIYNSHVQEQTQTTYSGMGNGEYHYFMTVSKRGAPGSCIECGQCEKACPQHLPIADNLKTVAAAFAPAMAVLTRIYSMDAQ
jgi:predicted aldo/keto reductase-like oxidoreductase